MEMTALVLAASLLGGWEPSSADGEGNHEKEGTRGGWHLYTLADPFGDPEGWFAAAPTVDGTGEIRFECMAEEGSNPKLRAFTEGLGREVRGGQWDSEGMAIHLKVDGGKPVEFSGTRPNELAEMDKFPDSTYLESWLELFGHPHANVMVQMLQDGGRAVIRFEVRGYGVSEAANGRVSLRRTTGRKYMFAVSLDGFREASEWVIGKCGWRN